MDVAEQTSVREENNEADSCRASCKNRFLQEARVCAAYFSLSESLQ
jgi:hypothetical protein